MSQKKEFTPALGIGNAARLDELGIFSKVVSSLVFHQTPLIEKRSILFAMYSLLQPNGRLFIADYGLQRTSLMKGLFRGTVQVIDGYEDTQPNAEGCMPGLLGKAGFLDISEVLVIPTPTGSISIYAAARNE